MGLAYLPDGTRIPYEDYLQTGWWRRKRSERLAFDNWQCAFCHTQICEGQVYNTHHLNYARLGHENVEYDLVSLCIPCHEHFHKQWCIEKDWNGGESDPQQHWADYSLMDTARLCLQYIGLDYWFGGTMNLCSEKDIQNVIEMYFCDNNIRNGPVISETDIKLYIRNRRYIDILDSIAAGYEMEDYLDKRFGTKGGSGGNPTRARARSFYKGHPVSTYRRCLNENESIKVLSEYIKNMEVVNHE